MAQNPNLAMFGRAAQAQPGGPSNMHMNAAEMAQMGRFGDSIIAHLTPGEIAVPPQVQTPKVLATIKHAMQKAGAQPNDFVAGSPQSSHNPMTGAPEYNFLSAVLPAVLGTVGAVAAPFTAGASLLPAAALAAGGSALGSAAGTALTGGTLGQSLLSGGMGAAGGLAGPALDGIGSAATGALGAGAAAADSGLAQGLAGAASGAAGSGAASGAAGAAGGVGGAALPQIAGAAEAGALPGMVPPAAAAADRAATFGGADLMGGAQGGSPALAAMAGNAQQGAAGAPAAAASNTAPLGPAANIPSGSMPSNLATGGPTAANPMNMHMGAQSPIDWNDVGKAIKVAGAIAPIAAAGIGALGQGGNGKPQSPPGFNTPLGPVNPNYNQILGNGNAPTPNFKGYNPIQTATRGPQYNFFQPR